MKAEQTRQQKQDARIEDKIRRLQAMVNQVSRVERVETLSSLTKKQVARENRHNGGMWT